MDVVVAIGICVSSCELLMVLGKNKQREKVR